MSEACDIVQFGPFGLDTARRVLTRGGEPVPLSSRAFDILALLVEHRDRVMTKDEIITRVWRGIAVEENNLAVQVSALRRALTEADLEAPLILTVPGQGYRFVGRVNQATPPAIAIADAAPLAAPAAAPLVAGPEIPSPVLPLAPPAPPRRPVWLWPALAGLALAAIGALYMVLRPAAAPPVTAAPPAPPRLSIAVLPFRDLSDDRCCAYLADAVSDDLTTDLAHIPGSVVIARESSDMYRDQHLPTAQIGQALNVRYLLEGSLRAVEGNFSINAQLIEAASGAHLWAEHFNVPRNHLGDAQDAVVHRLASALGVTLVQIEGTAASRERGSDPDARGLFFQARSIVDRYNTLEAMTQARHLLEQALARQPDFADALCELAMVLAQRLNNIADQDYGSDLEEAQRIGAEALRVAPNSSTAQTAHGILLSLDGKWGEAKASLEQALANDPESVPLRIALINCLNKLGQFEPMLQAILDLMRIDPEGPHTKARYFLVGYADVMLGRPREGLVFLDKAQAGEPDPEPGADDLSPIEWSLLYRIAAHQMLGDSVAAKSGLAQHDRIWPNRSAWQLGTSFTRAQAALPGARQFVQALVDAGMPFTIPLPEDAPAAGVRAETHYTTHRPFDLTPATLPGATLIRTADLRALLDQTPPPRIVNLGSRAVTLPHTLAEPACHFDPSAQDRALACAQFLNGDRQGGPVVVMGRNVVDWDGYNGALRLAEDGVPRVRWYRGGEEAWFAAGGPRSDERP